MTTIVDWVRVATATTGTGTITLGAAVRSATGGDGLTFAEAGVADGDEVSYFIQDGANRASGAGTYTASGTTLSRDPDEVSWNGSARSVAPLSLSGSAVVYIAARAVDLVRKIATATGEIVIAQSADGTKSIWFIADDADGTLLDFAGGPLVLTSNSGAVLVGIIGDDGSLSMQGLIESAAGGFKFPDATVQATAMTQARVLTRNLGC